MNTSIFECIANINAGDQDQRDRGQLMSEFSRKEQVDRQRQNAEHDPGTDGEGGDNVSSFAHARRS